MISNENDTNQERTAAIQIAGIQKSLDGKISFFCNFVDVL